MTETEKRVPDLRFKGFIEDWEQRKLGDIAEIKTGPFGSTLHAEDYVQSGIPIITTEHFKSGHLPESKDGTPQVSDEDYSRLKSYILKKGDIVFSRVGSVDINALVTTLQDGWLFSGRVLRVRSQNQIDSDYLHYLLDTLPVKNDIVSRAVGQTMPSINTEILKSTKLVLSKNIEEQELIAGTLRKLDDTLALHQRKLTLLEQLKQTYQLGMFPHNGGSIPALRFAGFSEPWEQRKLNDLYEKGGSGGTPQSTNKSYYKGDIPFLGISDISASNGYIYDTEKHISKKGLNNSSAWIVPKEAISLAMYASVGKVAILKTEAATSQAFYNMVFKKISTRNFIFQYLLKIESTNGWNRLISTGTQANLNAQKVRDLEIMIPSLEEQDKIGTFFNRIDHTIDLHQKKISHIQDLKKALLQKMFI